MEDDALLVKFLRATLMASGFTVDVAPDGPAAVSYLSAHAVDLILLDLGLPEIDGMDFLRQVRAWSNVPVMVLSARDQQDEKVQALDLDADDYLPNRSACPSCWRGSGRCSAVSIAHPPTTVRV